MDDKEINNMPQLPGNGEGAVNQSLDFLSEEEILKLYGNIIEGGKPILMAKGCGGCCGANGCYGK